MPLGTASLHKLTEFNFRLNDHFSHLWTMCYTPWHSKIQFEIWNTHKIANEDQQHFWKVHFPQPNFGRIFYLQNTLQKCIVNWISRCYSVSDDRDTESQNLTLEMRIVYLIFEPCISRWSYVICDLKFGTTPKTHLKNNMCVRDRVLWRQFCLKFQCYQNSINVHYA